MQTAHDQVEALLDQLRERSGDPVVEKLSAQISVLCRGYMEPAGREALPGVTLTPNGRNLFALLQARLVLAAGYDFLRATPPFRGWKLPPAYEIGFAVVASCRVFADLTMQDGMPIIRVSEATNGHTVTLLATLAHELCHLRQFRFGDSGNHNALFHRLARSVCRAHGFDLRSF